MDKILVKITIFTLILISMFFNATVGYSVLAPLFLKVLMSAAYASLDCAAYIISEKIASIRGFWLKQIAKVSLLHFILLSIFAAYTANVIINVTHEYDTYQTELDTINNDIDFAQSEIERWTNESKENPTFKSKHERTAEKHKITKAELVDKRQELNSNAPPSPNQAVFSKIVNDFDLPFTPEKLQNIILINFVCALAWAGLLLSLISSDLKKRKKRRSVLNLIIKSLFLKDPVQTSLRPRSESLKKPAMTMSPEDLIKYDQVRSEVQRGLNVSYENIKSFGVGTKKAQYFISKLEREQIIKRVGKKYYLKIKLENKKPVLQLVK